MKNVSNKKALVEFFKQKPKVQAPPPKFKIGDYIINSKFKVISKIIDIINVFDNEDRSINYEVAMYVMKDIKNDARDKFMADRMLTSQDSVSMKVERKYKRQKFVHAIDATYNKISPEVAQTLYGIKVNDDEGDNSVQS